MPKVWYDTRPSITVNDRVWYKWLTTGTPLYSLDRDTAIWNSWTSSTRSRTLEILEHSTTSYSMERIWVSWQVNHAIETEYHRRRIDAQFIARHHETQVFDQAQARRTARQLLTAHLSDAQLETFESAGCFDVISQHRRRYRIYCNRGVMHNVFLIDAEGNHLFEMCAYTPGVPAEDNFMAQKLYLEHQEDEFLRMANIWDRRPGMSRTVSHEGRSWRPPGGLGDVVPERLHLVAA